MAEELKAELTIDEAAAYTNCSSATLRRAVRAGKLPRRYISSPHGVALVFMPVDLDHWRASTARAIVDANLPVEVAPVDEQLPVPMVHDMQILLHNLNDRIAQQDQALADARDQILRLHQHLGAIERLSAQAATQDHAISTMNDRLATLQEQLTAAMSRRDEHHELEARAENNEQHGEALMEPSRRLLKRVEIVFDPEQRQAQHVPSQTLLRSLADRVASEEQAATAARLPLDTDQSNAWVISPDQVIAAPQRSSDQPVAAQQWTSVHTSPPPTSPAAPEVPVEPPSLAMRIARGSTEDIPSNQAQPRKDVLLPRSATKRRSWLQRIIYGD